MDKLCSYIGTTTEIVPTFLFGKGTRSYGTMIVDRIYSFCSPRLELDVMI